MQSTAAKYVQSGHALTAAHNLNFSGDNRDGRSWAFWVSCWVSLVRQALPWDAAFLAGQAFKVYRGAQGAKTSPMPDFYIGAHALVNGLQLLTRDAARYRSYFPRLQIVAPEA